MKVLVIGQGGREHALLKALNSSPLSPTVFVLPGNDAMAQEAEKVDIPSTDIVRVVEFCRRQKIDLVVIGPEAELVAGLADALRAENILVFGPSKAGAQLEGSKIFAKEFMVENRIPTARAVVVSSVDEVKKAMPDFKPPYVLKADGLAAGKGVFICGDSSELLAAAASLFEKKILGKAGDRALLEQFLPGKELSWLVITNGKEFSSLPLCRDHKRLQDGDKGPNTGGMGVVGPLTIDSSLRERIEREVIVPTIQGIAKRGFVFRGIVYVGLILADEGPQVLEYNTRFGDPECQVIMPLLDGDWLEVLKTYAKGESVQLQWRDESVACVVVAAEGYPDSPVKGTRIEGDATYSGQEGYILHAGTKRMGDHFVTNGGRVLNAIGRGSDLPTALKNAYAVANKVTWRGKQMRSDIGIT